VVGLGSIGRRHLRNLKRLLPALSVGVWRRQALASGDVELDALVERFMGSAKEATAFAPDLAVIATPAAFHLDGASALIEQGIPLLIEKPLSHRLDGIDGLIGTARERGLPVAVGYNLRFYWPLLCLRQAVTEGKIGRVVSFRAEVGQFLPDWRRGSDYRSSASARAELGGGVLLELSHELDYARWLLGEVKAVSASLGRLGNLEIDVEDSAEILVEFASGAAGSIHLDMLQRVLARTCRVIGTEGTLEWSWQDHRVRLYTAAAQAWTDLYGPGLVDSNEMYLDELRDFLDCLQQHRAPRCTLEDGKRVLQIVDAVRQSAGQRRMIEL
jgi:predicted dehydrogenase